LNLEVTESVLIEDAVAAVATMSSLRALGVHLHIDDFGTGYSSLSYLYRFPIDALKIDRAFIARLDGGGRNSRIVHNIVMLAHDLGLSIIAEGAETPEQVAMIEALGCEQVQGYVISRPLESARVVEFLACLHDKPLAVADPAAGIATMCQAGRIFECGGQLVVDN
jgi:EAL domain-containing protein (putative c-di-GMP-specific phosphodiesterase class I)